MAPHCNIAREVAKEVSVYEMEHSGYKASIMAAEKLKDNGLIHPLPPGNAIPVIPIHCLPGCPDGWIRESGSYVVPVTEDIGLWFDWTMNDQYMTAVVPSVKSMNPITGQKLEGCQMEQYRDECPVHHIPFAHERYCGKCDYKWPPQNYVGGSGVTRLWWDGIYQSDGTVRQFFFTADMAKDVASCLIGKENTVPAFGFAFFRYTKEVVRERNITRGLTNVVGYYKSIPAVYNYAVYSNTGGTFSNTNGILSDRTLICCQASNSAEELAFKPQKQAIYRVNSKKCLSREGEVPDSMMLTGSVDEVSEPVNYSCDHINVLSEEEGRALRPSMYELVKEVSVGAGAAIRQNLELDMRSLKDYHTEPQAVMRVYFVFEPQLRDIVARGGIKKIEGIKEGFLKGVPVGA